MNKKILLVDDSLTQLAGLKVLLTKAGFEVLTAESGSEGINTVFKTWPDLIISDIIMPEINGYHLCRLLKNDDLTKDIPIILLTHLSEKIDKFWGLRAGADAFLTKDSDFNFILAEIEKFLNNSPVLPAATKANQLVNKELDDLDLQTKITQLLDESLIESTIINDFRNLSELIRFKRS